MPKGTLTARPKPANETAPPSTPAPTASAPAKGVNLQDIVTWFDNFSILLRRDGQSQLVYKHAISTIMPSQPVDAAQFNGSNDNGRKQRLLQDIFLSRV